MPPTQSDAPRPFLTRPLPWAIGIGALLIAGLVVWDWRIGRDRGVAPQPIPLTAGVPAGAPPGAPPTGPLPAPPAIATTAPSFDIVRINPQGNAVMAGRAVPGAELMLRDGDRDLGRARADAQGNWVFLPAAPLPPGARELSVVERTPAGEERRGESTVLLVVPDQAAQAAGGTPMAVLSTPGAPPRMLQGPEPGREPVSAATGATGAAQGRLSVDAVDYDERGEVRFAGTAPPEATLRLYVDNLPIGDATADAQGRWTLAPAAPVPPGDHTLRLDQVGAGGRVASRVELPFRREAQALAEEGRVVVQPGQSLWLLARQAYGHGTRYTVIYAANKDAIRDPRLIYPGQTFTLPAASEPAAHSR